MSYSLNSVNSIDPAYSLSRTNLQAGAAPHHKGQGEAEDNAKSGPADLHHEGLALQVENKQIRWD